MAELLVTAAGALIWASALCALVELASVARDCAYVIGTLRVGVVRGAVFGLAFGAAVAVAVGLPSGVVFGMHAAVEVGVATASAAALIAAIALAFGRRVAFSIDMGVTFGVAAGLAFAAALWVLVGLVAGTERRLGASPGIVVGGLMCAATCTIVYLRLVLEPLRVPVVWGFDRSKGRTTRIAPGLSPTRGIIIWRRPTLPLALLFVRLQLQHPTLAINQFTASEADAVPRSRTSGAA